MRRNGERGEIRIQSLISLIVLVWIVYLGFQIIPIYYDHYDLVDKVNEICRTPRYKARTDEVIMDMLMKEVRQRRVDQWIGARNFIISTTDTNRRIILRYEREGLLFPGRKKVFKFEFQSDQPLV